jgi:Protein of unknown function (DUF1553)/Protein of unknown function (DUF1549)/Planctomycete cytochrome C
MAPLLLAHCRVLACWLALLAALAASTCAADDPKGVAFFETKIRPVLIEKCHECHSIQARKPKGGLQVDSRAAIRAGGTSGPAVVPGDLDASLLYQAISAADGVEPMPPKGKLPASVVADFRQWITMGAPDPREGTPAEPATAALSAKSRDWWSLRPLQDASVPYVDPAMSGWVHNPIDAFILAKLKEKNLQPAPEADRRTLIRRLSFDLLGLPPATDEVARYLQDRSPDAYERLVDRLLASPHFGERWARHWMDLVHFAETHGHDQDRIRPNAWPYRDYLIDSFNGDTPYARFVQEQVAADSLFPDEPRLAIAQGMLAAGPWDESSLRDIRDDSVDRHIGYYIDRDDMVTTVMSTFASMTVHCARCHDHKFDPISQEDYYALQAVFAGVDKAERGYDADRVIDAMRHRLKLEVKATEPRNAELAAWLKVELAALPPQAMVFAAASDFLPDNSHVPPGKPRLVHVLKRGDIHQPGKAASPGTVSCVNGLPARFSVTPDDDESARRAALARWITDPGNPLTWRSIVNRVWHWHFGRGLVSTPNDFGRMGSLPSHPELVDWLASRFVESRGSLKSLHRLIVTSAVYRQSARHEASFAAIDGDNQWLWRQNRRRLDAESIHDAILCISGQLDPTMRGPSVQQFALRPGVHVTPVVDYSQYDWTSNGSCRRSVYRFLFRTLPDPFFDALDSADASQLTAVRNESTTPLQALELLNNPFVLRQCEEFARNLQKSHGGRVDEQVRIVIELAYGREAASDELELLSAYAASHGMANLCRIIVNSNEFLYVN